MFVVENDYVIEAFAADASDDSLRIRILPRASWSRPRFPNTHSLNSVLEVFPIDSISITNQIARCLIIRKRFDDLLCRPSRLRMFGHIKVNDSASFMRQHNEYKKHAQSSSRYREEVDRHEIAGVIIEEGSPRLGRRGAPFWHESGNGTFGNLDAQLLQFPMNSRRAPAHIGFGHRLNQFADIGSGPRTSWIGVLG